MAEDGYIEDDADSAKGSLPQDSSDQSLTNNEKNPDMFHTVECDNRNERSYSLKRILEDYEKPKLKEKNCKVTISPDDSEEKIPPRSYTNSWNPIQLLEVLYSVHVKGIKRSDIEFVEKSTCVDILPPGIKVATSRNPWINYYTKLKDGVLECAENPYFEDTPKFTFPLIGCKIENIDVHVLQIDDQEGRCLVLKFHTYDERNAWKKALETHYLEDCQNTRPWTFPLPEYNVQLSKDLYPMYGKGAQHSDSKFINKVGFLDVLLPGKKATSKDPWKRCYAKLNDGVLRFYNNPFHELSLSLQLNCAIIEELDDKALGIDDQKGHRIILDFSKNMEFDEWKTALQSHCTGDIQNTSPCPWPVPQNKGAQQLDLVFRFVERLPLGKKVATSQNLWKNTFARVNDGVLSCHDGDFRKEPGDIIFPLKGSTIEKIADDILGIDDQKGNYLVLKFVKCAHCYDWKDALESCCSEDFQYTSRCFWPLPQNNQKIAIVDLGGSSIRAGILMSNATLPQLYFPTICAENNINSERIFGMNALKPVIRKISKLSFPLCPTEEITKESMDVTILPDLLSYIFKELNVSPKDYTVVLSIPQKLSTRAKQEIASILLDDFEVKGCNLTHQAISSLHGYNTKSGIIVNIGDRLDVIPIVEGYIIERGVSNLPYGGRRMLHHVKQSLAEQNIRLDDSEVETYIARYVMEKLCYVAKDYKEELHKFHRDPDDFKKSTSTSKFIKNDRIPNKISLDMGRFHVPEGLFVPEKWGLDHPGLHKLVHHAIQEAGIDVRREMNKSIFISGGVTLLPGIVERLEYEINKMTPSTVIPKVHASAYRLHMPYIGACNMALDENFKDVCITKKQWREEGVACVQKWHI